jgi:quercetin dioxygenase-like cupin family protein
MLVFGNVRIYSCDDIIRGDTMKVRFSRFATASFVVLSAFLTLNHLARSQAVGGAEAARAVAGDPGISSMVVIDGPEYRVLRDYAEPGATRRMHNHSDATWHVFTLVTGRLLLTIEGEPPKEVTQGQVLALKGGVNHTFKNTGDVTATIVEVFGKAKAEDRR